MTYWDNADIGIFMRKELEGDSMKNDKNHSRIQIWSCGGGTQSAAIAALIVRGDLQKPDLSVIVDTERECTSTWEYFDDVLRPRLLSIGVVLHRVRKSDFTNIDLFAYKKQHLMLGAFSTKDGAGKLRNFCSNKWKKEVVERFSKKMFPKSKGFDHWLGISADELERVHFDPKDSYRQRKYPLIDLKMNRRNCVALVESMGWGTPPRSRCWMCPNQSQAEWDSLRADYPEDFARAVVLEKEIHARDAHAFLHRSRKPLSEMDAEEPDLFGGQCMEGLCYV